MKNKTIKEFRNTSNSDLEYYKKSAEDIDSYLKDLEYYKKSAEDIDSKDIDFNIPETRLKQLFNNALSTLKIELKDFIPNIDVNKEINYEKFLKLVYIMCIEDPEFKETLQIKFDSYEVKVINDNFYKNLNIKNNFKYLFEAVPTTDADSGFTFIFEHSSYDLFKTSIFNYFKRKLTISNNPFSNFIDTTIQNFFNSVFKATFIEKQISFSFIFGSFFEEIINACTYRIINGNNDYNFSEINFDDRHTKFAIIIILLLKNNFDNSTISIKYLNNEKPEKADYLNVFKENDYFLTREHIQTIETGLIEYFIKCRKALAINDSVEICCKPYKQDEKAPEDFSNKSTNPRFDFIFRNKDELINHECLYKIGLFDIKSSIIRDRTDYNIFKTGSNTDGNCVQFFNDIIEQTENDKTKYNVYFLGIFRIKYQFNNSLQSDEIINEIIICEMISGVLNSIENSLNKDSFYIAKDQNTVGYELKTKHSFVTTKKHDDFSLYNEYLDHIYNLFIDNTTDEITIKINSEIKKIENYQYLVTYIDNFSFYIITKKILNNVSVDENYEKIFSAKNEKEKQKIKKIIENNQNRPDIVNFKIFYLIGASEQSQYNSIINFYIENRNDKDKTDFEKFLYTIERIFNSIKDLSLKIYNAYKVTNSDYTSTDFDNYYSNIKSNLDKYNFDEFTPNKVFTNALEKLKENLNAQNAILNILQDKNKTATTDAEINTTQKNIKKYKEEIKELQFKRAIIYEVYDQIVEIEGFVSHIEKKIKTYTRTRTPSSHEQNDDFLNGGSITLFLKMCIFIKFFFNWLNIKGINNKEVFNEKLNDVFNMYKELLSEQQTYVRNNTRFRIIFKKFFELLLFNIDNNYKSELLSILNNSSGQNYFILIIDFILDKSLENEFEEAKKGHNDYINQKEQLSIQTDSIIRNNLMSLVEVYSFLYKMH